MKVVEMRAGDPAAMLQALDYILKNCARLAQAAGQFAARYHDFNPQTQVEKLVQRLELLLGH